MKMETVKDIPILGLIKFKTNQQLSVDQILACQKKYDSSYVKDFKHGRKWYIIMRRNNYVSYDDCIKNHCVSVSSNLNVRTSRDHYVLKEYHIDRCLNHYQMIALERQFNGEFVTEYKTNALWVVVMRHEIESSPRSPPPPPPSLEEKTDGNQIMSNDEFVNSLMNSAYRV